MKKVKNDDIRSRLGQCYVLSYKYVTSHIGWNLVHGYISDRFTLKTIDHAWCEHDDMVFDPVLNDEYPKVVYYALFKAEVAHFYSCKDAMNEALKSETYGPWVLVDDTKVKGYRNVQ